MCMSPASPKGNFKTQPVLVVWKDAPGPRHLLARAPRPWDNPRYPRGTSTRPSAAALHCARRRALGPHRARDTGERVSLLADRSRGRGVGAETEFLRE